MTTLVKIQRKGQMTLPSRLRTAAGVTEGDIIEASFQRGKIVLTPKRVVDRSEFPNADDEYTPAQRRVIDRRLAASDKDIASGRTYGPFGTAEEAIASMKVELKKRKAGPKTRRAR
jgi:AbrB family looped-hinge helix DNA binding protein